MVIDHFETFVSEYDSRFREIYGKLRDEAQNAFLNFRRCGDPNFGITLFRCDTCDVSLGVPFTCKARICPSCLARKAETRAIHLSEVIPKVDHRHLVFGLPKKMGLRQRIQEDPKLLRKVTRLVNQTITEHLLSCVRIHRNRKDELEGARPGIIVAQHTWADNLDYHPHLHLCITDGVFTKSGDFYTPWDWKPDELKEKLRRKVLRAFVRWEKLTPEAADIVACWELEKCGFSLFIGSPIAADDRDRLARLLRYLMRSPVSFKRLKYNERTGKVEMRLKRDQIKVFNHAVDFLAALARHVPRARQQTVTYAGHYANSTGNLSGKADEVEEELQEQRRPTSKPRYIPWNLLVLRCWAVDPELCPLCGETMRRDKPIYKQPELSRLLNSLRIGRYPERPPPAPPPALSASPSHEKEFFEAQEFGDNVVQLFPDDNFNQVPPGW